MTRKTDSKKISPDSNTGLIVNGYSKQPFYFCLLGFAIEGIQNIFVCTLV